jgi:hypothetical protein
VAQHHKGERDLLTIKLPGALRARVAREAARHHYRQPGVYLADLISALHPNPEQAPQMAQSLNWVIPTLLQDTQEVDGPKKKVTVRTPKGVKARIKVALNDYGYPDMIAYLGTLISTLHPADGTGREAASARALVSALFNDDHFSVFAVTGGLGQTMHGSLLAQATHSLSAA